MIANKRRNRIRQVDKCVVPVILDKSVKCTVDAVAGKNTAFVFMEICVLSAEKLIFLNGRYDAETNVDLTEKLLLRVVVSASKVPGKTGSEKVILMTG
jgi:hypothetical protein